MSDSEKPKSAWRERIKRIKHKLTDSCASFDRKCKPTELCLEHCAILNILGHAGRPVAILTIIVGMVVYVMDRSERQMQAENQRKAKHYQAWQVISAAQGKPGDLGRTIALQDLHRAGISLAGVDISMANLPKLNLEKADLSEAFLSNAILSNAKFSGANFRFANLYDTDLHKADLSGADLTHANLNKAHLTEANISDANLWYADIYDADLWYANLSGANLTSIKGWKGVKNIRNANIYGVKNPPEGFKEWAKKNGAVEIEDEKKWIEYIRKKEQEKTQQKE